MDEKRGIFRFILIKILGPFVILSLVFYTIFVVIAGVGISGMEDSFTKLASTIALEPVHVFVKSTAGYEINLERRMAELFEKIKSSSCKDVNDLSRVVDELISDFKTHVLEEKSLGIDYVIMDTSGSVIKPGELAEVDKSRFTLDVLKGLKVGEYIFKRIDEAYTMEGKEAFVKSGYFKVFPDVVLVIRFYIKWLDVRDALKDVREIPREIRVIRSINLYTSCLKPMASVFDPLDPSLVNIAEEVLKSGDRAVLDEGWHKKLIISESLPIFHDRQFSKRFLAVVDLDFSLMWVRYAVLMIVLGGAMLSVALVVIFRVRKIARIISSSLNKLVNAISNYSKSRDFETVLNLERTGIEEIDSLMNRFQEMAETIATHVERLEAANELLESSYKELEKIHEEVENAYLSFGKGLAMIAEGYDENTGNHITRVGELSALLAEKMGMGEYFVRRMRHYAPLHDIGKILVRKEILLKPGKLTEDEFEEMKRHTLYGVILLEDVPGFEMVRNIALYHHEKFDGTGYPFGLKGDSIPIEAQIVGLIDVYDALRSKRPYKEAFDHETAMEIILKGDGRTKPENFNPEILKVFAEISEDIKTLWEKIWDRETLLEEKFRRYFRRSFS